MWLSYGLHLLPPSPADSGLQCCANMPPVQAALLGSGLYLATTPGWQQMTSRELCLLQLVAAHSVLEVGAAYNLRSCP